MPSCAYSDASLHVGVVVCQALVQEGKVQQSRIDEAVTRILTVRQQTHIQHAHKHTQQTKTAHT